VASTLCSCSRRTDTTKRHAGYSPPVSHPPNWRPQLPGMALGVIMPRPYRTNNENLICVALLKLKRHLMSCRACSSYRTLGTFDQLCDETKYSILMIAEKWDNNVGKRLAAKNGNAKWVFPCPDTSQHGSAYALTAEAVIVSDVQEALF
jgi:hypothetical protein